MNPGVEVNVAFGGRKLLDVDRDDEGLLREILCELYDPRNDRAADALVGIFQRAEEAFFGRLPARYAWLPFSLSGSLLWLSAALLTVAGFLRRRKAMARRLAEMDAEEAAEEAARRIAAAEAPLAPVPPEDPDPGDPPEDPGKTVH